MAVSERIHVSGIRPKDSSIGPAGHHLRWSFPARLGFPAKGFGVYRRVSTGFKTVHCLDLTKSKVPTGKVVTSGSSLEGVTFRHSDDVEIRGNGTALSIQPPTPTLLELTFAQPTAYVRLVVEGAAQTVMLRAFSGNVLVATSDRLIGSGGTLEVKALNITRVTLPLQFRALVELCHLSMDGACQDNGWGQAIAELPLIKSVNEGLARLESTLKNRYATDRTRAVQRYSSQLQGLIDWLQLLQRHVSAPPPGAVVPPNELRLPATDPTSPLDSIRPQGILLLSALDPNIARFLSLYWVDQFGGTNGVQRGSAYDYKVAGGWSNAEVGCGMIFGLGVKEANLPSVDTPLEGGQLAGLRWQLHGALQIGEEHRDLLALAFESGLGDEDLLGQVLGGVGRGRGGTRLPGGLTAAYRSTALVAESGSRR
jgi:hypothetical protein